MGKSTLVRFLSTDTTMSGKYLIAFLFQLIEVGGEVTKPDVKRKIN